MSAMKCTNAILLLTCTLLSACATQLQQQKMNVAGNTFASGNLVGTKTQIDDAFKQKDSLYYLEHGSVLRLISPEKVKDSTLDFLQADKVVSDWEYNTKINLSKNLSDFGGYLFSEGVNKDYRPKAFEISALSYHLAINHISSGQWGAAMVEAKKMGLREKIIFELNEKKYAAIEEKANKSESNSKGVTKNISEIAGYPVNLLNDPSVVNLKNSYQSAAAHYLAGFIFEQQGEIGLAAPGYRLAIELQPNEPMLQEALANLEKNVSEMQSRSNGTVKKKVADTLFVIETGFLAPVESFKINKLFSVGTGPKVVSLSFPVIGASKDLFVPKYFRVNDIDLSPRLITNVDAQARRELKDEMPSYVLRATTRAITSLITQVAAQKAAEQQQRKNNNNNGGNAALVGSIVGLLTGAALQAINVADVRHWTTLPAHIYMARVKLADGEQSLSYQTPSGQIRTSKVTLTPGYNLVYLRMFKDSASLITSQDQQVLAALRIKEEAAKESKAAIVLKSDVPAEIDSKSESKSLSGLLSNQFDLVKGIFKKEGKE